MAGLELGNFDGLAVLGLREGALDGFAVGLVVEIQGSLMAEQSDNQWPDLSLATLMGWQCSV